jgi:hypothetical protein
MKTGAKVLITILVVWNVSLSIVLYLSIQNHLRLENNVRNIYNKATNLNNEELNEEGSAWNL